MRLWLFDGTPDEFLRVADVFKDLAAQSESAMVTREVATENIVRERNDDREVTQEEAVRILRRIPVSENMQAVLKHLAAAQKEVPSDYLRNQVVKLNGDQFRGLMGAFGRRVIHTVPEQSVTFFNKRWNGDQYYWSLTDNARRAVLQELG